MSSDKEKLNGMLIGMVTSFQYVSQLAWLLMTMTALSGVTTFTLTEGETSYLNAMSDTHFPPSTLALLTMIGYLLGSCYYVYHCCCVGICCNRYDAFRSIYVGISFIMLTVATFMWTEKKIDMVFDMTVVAYVLILLGYLGEHLLKWYYADSQKELRTEIKHKVGNKQKMAFYNVNKAFNQAVGKGEEAVLVFKKPTKLSLPGHDTESQLLTERREPEKSKDGEAGEEGQFEETLTTSSIVTTLCQEVPFKLLLAYIMFEFYKVLLALNIYQNNITAVAQGEFWAAIFIGVFICFPSTFMVLLFKDWIYGVIICANFFKLSVVQRQNQTDYVWIVSMGCSAALVLVTAFSFLRKVKFPKAG